jgi:integrase
MINETVAINQEKARDGDLGKKIEHVIDAFLHEKKKKTNSEGTYRQYASVLRLARNVLQNNQCDFFSEKEKVADLLFTFIGTQKRTRQLRLSVLNSFYMNKNVQACFGKENPVPLIKKKFPKKKRVYIRSAMVSDVLQQRATEKDNRDISILLLMLETEMNATALSQLKIKDIDINNQTCATIKEIPLHRTTTTFLLRYLFGVYGEDIDEEHSLFQSYAPKKTGTITTQGITSIIKKRTGLTTPFIDQKKLKKVLDSIEL